MWGVKSRKIALWTNRDRVCGSVCGDLFENLECEDVRVQADLLTQTRLISQPTASSASSSKKVIQASNRLYDIQSLENDGSNFQDWKFRAKKVLIVRRLWGIVTGTEAQPRMQYKAG
ncbi:hypothetical protein DFJ58DRAFT_700782 [Suillus subalutaceus]|uniref:uncharacterized protein n=1 Tax=Suillus subalutaceus TaxID=48586 RepID=UPI001B877E41|nr:uncharacterized protein DFJ58DRAFT_700782 [Suillus subalutaceus]KAG1861802.1 hypothetical protein DFJ58DRAFT_700782 [Suillus subalutaceus]